ncbi:MAG: hypothetical protein HKL88_08660 [Bacteroidia bacterium]|nr:hypothetical protein [Bacteroidia bacterium]
MHKNLNIKKVLIFGIILLSTFAYWRLSNSFFFSDEWPWMVALLHPTVILFFKAYNTHIMPVYLFVYFLELKIFGVQNNYYQYLSLLIYAGGVYAAYKTMRFGINNSNEQNSRPMNYIYLAAALFIIANPINSDLLSLSLTIDETLLIFFQACAVLFFLKYTRTGGTSNLLLFLAFLILQNYSFGNGIFFPLIFIVYALLFRTPAKARLIIIGSAAFAGMFMIQVLWGLIGDSGHVTVFNHLPVIIKVFFLFMDINICRSLFIYDFFHSKLKIACFLLLTAVIFIGYKNKSSDKKLVTLYSAWFFASSISVPLGRYQTGIEGEFVPYYYSVLGFMPLVLLLVEVFYYRLLAIMNRNAAILAGAFLLLIISFFFIDQKREKPISAANVQNEIAMKNAVADNKVYYGINDPFCSETGYGRDTALRHVKDAYQYWGSHALLKASGN